MNNNNNNVQVGVLPELPDESVVKKARLEPGKMFLVDLDAGKIVPDDSVKEKYANRLPYAEWLEESLINITGWTEHSQATGTKVWVWVCHVQSAVSCVGCARVS